MKIFNTKNYLDILKTLNLENLDLNKIIQGQDPILPSPFLIGQAGAAALGIFGYLTAEIWAMKTRKKIQKISISVRDAALAQISHTYLKLLDQDTPPLWDPVSGFYLTQDHRWIQLHCNFPHHRAGVVKFLKAEDNKESVIEKIKHWEAQALEDALSKEGLCAAMVRSPEEWEKHPQAQALKNLPLFEIIKIGESESEFKKIKTSENRPLSGFKVLDLSRVIAGPVCGKILAEQGAQVMRVEHPDLPFVLPLFLDTTHGKFSSFLDLDKKTDQDNLKNLIKESDVFLQAYRPGSLDKKGFSPEELIKIRPGLIYVSLSAYGHEGPFKDRHGYDSLVQSATGIAYEQSRGDLSSKPPKHLPAQSLDYLTGYFASICILAAIKKRAEEGGSYLIRVSLAQTAEWFKNLGRISNPEEYLNLTAPKAEAIPELITQSMTPYGRLQHMKPVIHFSETPSKWGRALPKRGEDPAAWE